MFSISILVVRVYFRVRRRFGTLPADWAPTLRNRWFADSVQEEEGFEFLVHLQRGQPCAERTSPFFRAQVHRLPSFFISENDDFELPASQGILTHPAT